VRIDGGGGTPWDGSFNVEPGNLEATAPGFRGVGESMQSTSELVSIWTSASSVGITEPTAGAAWERFVKVWVYDLMALGATYTDVGDHLSLGGIAYTHTDHTIESSYDLGP